MLTQGLGVMFPILYCYGKYVILIEISSWSGEALSVDLEESGHMPPPLKILGNLLLQ